MKKLLTTAAVLLTLTTANAADNKMMIQGAAATAFYDANCGRPTFPAEFIGYMKRYAETHPIEFAEASRKIEETLASWPGSRGMAIKITCAAMRQTVMESITKLDAAGVK